MNSTFYSPIYKLYGLSDKEEFTESEYKQLYYQYVPIHEMHSNKKEYDQLVAEKTAAENSLANKTTYNNNLPDLRDEKSAIQDVLDTIEDELLNDDLSYLDEKALLEDQERYQMELAELIAREQPQDTTAVEAKIATLTTTIGEKAIVINELSNQLGIGDLV